MGIKVSIDGVASCGVACASAVMTVLLQFPMPVADAFLRAETFEKWNDWFLLRHANDFGSNGVRHHIDGLSLQVVLVGACTSSANVQQSALVCNTGVVH
jgi:hypothetical protein